MSTLGSTARRATSATSAHEALTRSLSLALTGSADALEILERRPIPYRSTYPLEALEVRMPDGTAERLVFKDLSRTGASDPAWNVKASFLRDPLREIETYRDVLTPHRLSAPRFRAAITEPERGTYWLFLEYVEGDLLWQCGSAEVWHLAAAWLADLHARFHDRLATLPRRLLRYDSRYYRRWLERARRFVDWPAESVNGRRDFPWLAGRVEGALAWLDEQPPTLLHGEYCPANVLVERGAGAPRIRPLDWEMAAIGPGLFDLAALTAGPWSEAERHGMAEAYRAALPGAERPSAETLRRGLARCRLLSAVQWLGWSDGWRPPPQQDHDWLATALALAAEVPH